MSFEPNRQSDRGLSALLIFLFLALLVAPPPCAREFSRPRSSTCSSP
jgi:hypothetical protein